MRNLFLAATIASAILAAPSLANTMTFAGLPTDVSGPATYSEDGITATSASGLFWAWPDAGELHMDDGCCAGSSFDFTLDSGKFNLISFDVSYASDASNVVTLSTYDEMGGLLFSSFYDTSVLQTIPFTNFNNISKLTISIGGFDHFSMDNLVLQASVPEPATWAMLISGFGLVGAAARRRRTLAHG